jgi:hypothetical protein
MEPTADPLCLIEDRGEVDGVPYILYRLDNRGTMERWVIHGTCTCCGECEVGSGNPRLRWTGIPIGQPGACLDVTWGQTGRLDEPVRPELTVMMPHCSLHGEYISGDLP